MKGTIKLGDYYGEYTLNQEDMSGGEFSAWAGYGVPHGYFIYPSEAKDMGKIENLVTSLKGQCEDLNRAANRPDHIFKEIRVSRSPLSGLTSYLQAGYPVLYLNTPTQANKRNVYRVTR